MWPCVRFLKTGNDEAIPADLSECVYVAAVRYGGRAEYDAMRKIHENPNNPAQKDSAVYTSPILPASIPH
jgi:aminopeptidase 2